MKNDRSQLRHGRELRRLEDGRRRGDHAVHHLGQHRLRLPRRRPGDDPQHRALAVDSGVAIGAHPSLPDLMGFGRRAMRISPQDMYDLVLYQAGAVEAFARAAGVKLHHVKCHGALYNMAANGRGAVRRPWCGR